MTRQSGERILKVRYEYHAGKRQPAIRIVGNYLREAGFDVNGVYRLRVEPNRLTLNLIPAKESPQ